MYKIETHINDRLNEMTYYTKLSNGLNIYICKKEGFKKKIGMFGTKYGSLINDFIDINSSKRIKVPDGIAHFLEHKLFEKEGENALDMFSKIGVSSNAYTTFDHTVFYFETNNKFEESIKLLVKLIKEPYFTEENVKKEQGIIAQEILMGNDDPDYMVYFNTLKAMYQKNNVRIDIAGTIESISNITKDLLYTCYNTFYNLNNMFFVVVGDVDVEKTIKLIEDSINIYSKNEKKINEEIKTFSENEPMQVAKREIIEKMDVYMPKLCIGYKLNVVQKEEIIKRAILADIVSDMYFSKLSKFYEEEYSKGIITDEVILSYEGTEYFSHVVIMGESTKLLELKSDILKYIEKIKKYPIDTYLFEQVKSNKIGSTLIENDRLNSCYRRIIDSILADTDVYADIEILQNLNVQDVKNFLELLDNENNVVSIIDKK